MERQDFYQKFGHNRAFGQKGRGRIGIVIIMFLQQNMWLYCSRTNSMNIRESAGKGNMKVLVWLSYHFNHNKSFKQMTKQDILDYLNENAYQSISNDPSFLSLYQLACSVFVQHKGSWLVCNKSSPTYPLKYVFSIFNFQAYCLFIGSHSIPPKVSQFLCVLWILPIQTNLAQKLYGSFIHEVLSYGSA